MFDLTAANNPIVVIVAFLLVLIPAVLIHELGHLIAAKLVGITILEFGIGMPPRLFKLFTWRGTEYTLNWLPLGGFVRPLGEDIVRQMGDEALKSDREIAIERGFEKPVSVNEAKPAGRIFFMAGGAIANFIMAFVIFVIIGLSGLPQLVGARVELRHIPADSPLAAAGLQSGDVIEEVNGEFFADAAALLVVLQSAGSQVDLTVIRPDEGQERFTLAVTDFDASDLTLSTHPIIQYVAPGSPAADAGLERDDLVTALNETPITSFEELQGLTAENLGQEVALTVTRDGESVSSTPPFKFLERDRALIDGRQAHLACRRTHGGNAGKLECHRSQVSTQRQHMRHTGHEPHAAGHTAGCASNDLGARGNLPHIKHAIIGGRPQDALPCARTDTRCAGHLQGGCLRTEVEQQALRLAAAVDSDGHRLGHQIGWRGRADVVGAGRQHAQQRPGTTSHLGRELQRPVERHADARPLGRCGALNEKGEIQIPARQRKVQHVVAQPYRGVTLGMTEVFVERQPNHVAAIAIDGQRIAAAIVSGDAATDVALQVRDDERLTPHRLSVERHDPADAVFTGNHREV